MRHRIRLAKLTRRLTPDGRPTSIDIMDLDGAGVYGTIGCSFDRATQTEVAWNDPPAVRE